MDFEIEPDGKILVKNQRYDLEDEIYRLMGFLLCVAHALEDARVPKVLAELS